eukprot:CAMPEP_0118943552 /NCGR_PEP_ID=MMETSP1169-20130426/38547_1 /TAXON_ID=36882 /ORGANISM="Pyramimonas obovata, Strain CCMP722" /LENGTH=318 /DNA_ID=CAMNT_0006888835 /DNA_START=52 /DNA_END=1004 /DNA_ORIENTATION=-
MMATSIAYRSHSARLNDQVSLSGRASSAYNGRKIPLGSPVQRPTNRTHKHRSITLTRATTESKDEEKPKKPAMAKKNAYAHWLANQPEELPSGEMLFTPPTDKELRSTSMKLFLQPLWKQIRWGSVLGVEVGSALSDSINTSPFSPDVTLPQLCSCLKKAAHDPRISGVYLKITPIGCGWAKLDELRRHIAYFRQSGKFCMAYMEVASEKEFYVAAACEEIYVPPSAYLSLRGVSVSGTFLRGVLEKVGVEPQIQRIGKYKSAGDQLGRDNMSKAQREVLTAIMESVYGNLTRQLAEDRSQSEGERTAEDVAGLLDEA